MSERIPDDDTPVVVRFAALGDTVLLTVLLDGLARRLGRPLDVLTSGAWARTLLEAQPYVRAVRTVTSRKRPYLLTPSQWEAVGWLRRHRGPIWLCDPEPAARRLVARGVPRERIIVAADGTEFTQRMTWEDFRDLRKRLTVRIFDESIDAAATRASGGDWSAPL